ncbi:hypothetical protein Q6D67_12100 [Haliea sp. E1-2-M8]|uniref:hypothetical protein n=1 Tax=Haliea sp. E1-2-M8 TaxID=3064706 RepID=UPI002725F9BC|nr:hypothetical protein [Haliea sp. E1-2-M8]MDO8862443.1 hypothetical protein [Haliea sp. E1-2-M8]
MVIEYQVFLCIVLTTRLVYLQRDDAVGWKFAGILGLAQAAIILVVFGSSLFTWISGGVALAFSVVGGWLETKGKVHWARLGVLASVALVPAVLYPVLGGFSLSTVSISMAGYCSDIIASLGYHQPVAAGRIASIFVAMLVLANEVNIAMRGIFSALNLVPRLASPPADDLDIREYNAGRVIGILERWLMLMVVLLADDWSALGFIIAAKGLVRFDKLKNPIFAEYMLIGTLLSALFAIAAASLVR